MAKKKILKKERVITAGAGVRRAVLCFDSGLVYQYDAPENVLAVFDGKSWIMPEGPRYSRPGWGNPSRGDVDGGILHDNASYLIRAVGGHIKIVSLPYLMSAKEFSEALRASQKVEKLEKQAKKLGVQVGSSFREENRTISFRDLGWTRSNKGKGTDVFRQLDALEKGLEVFKSGKGRHVQFSDYRISPDRITQGPVLVAYRKNNRVVMNSEVLRLTDFERNFLGGESLLQKEVRKLTTLSIPFNVLKAAELDPEKIRVIEQGPEETFEIRGPQGLMAQRHFTGAVLLENEGRKFFLDVDRREIQHKIFNAFFVEVASTVNSISEAYDSMKPQEVKDAEAAGIEVLRQGEWFFIPTENFIEFTRSQVFRWAANGEEARQYTQRVEGAELRHGRGRPNSLMRPIGFGPELDSLVLGTVTHSGREHEPLVLEGGDQIKAPDYSDQRGSEEANSKTYRARLYRVVGNTTVSNFTIQGGVD